MCTGLCLVRDLTLAQPSTRKNACASTTAISKAVQDEHAIEGLGILSVSYTGFELGKKHSSMNGPQSTTRVVADVSKVGLRSLLT